MDIPDKEFNLWEFTLQMLHWYMGGVPSRTVIKSRVLLPLLELDVVVELDWAVVGVVTTIGGGGGILVGVAVVTTIGGGGGKAAVTTMGGGP